MSERCKHWFRDVIPAVRGGRCTQCRFEFRFDFHTVVCGVPVHVHVPAAFKCRHCPALLCGQCVDGNYSVDGTHSGHLFFR